MDKTSLGDRMKAYESIPKNFLMRRTPVIIRIDGKAFHTFTRGFDKPFDSIIQTCMEETMKYCCENVQGCVLGYTQSDEISLILCDYQRLETDAWFGYNVQKIVSISASLATFAFNHVLGNIAADIFNENDNTFNEKTEFLMGKINQGALFDSRCFSLSKEEVCNYMIWRQRDATRNSILGLAQSLYSQKQIEGINTKKLQDKMFTEEGVNWNDLTTYQKRGSCCIKDSSGEWIIDNDIPIFSQDRDYIESRIVFPEDTEEDNNEETNQEKTAVHEAGRCM
jgi:tRNA(His) 5'-end guanylyltransferase